VAGTKIGEGNDPQKKNRQEKAKVTHSHRNEGSEKKKLNVLLKRKVREP